MGYERLSLTNPTTNLLNITTNDNGTTLVITGNAINSTYSTVLESIRYNDLSVRSCTCCLCSYNNVADEPNVTLRMIRYTINDGMFESSVDVNITIVPLNDNTPMVY